jgi:hypothetical protein
MFDMAWIPFPNHPLTGPRKGAASARLDSAGDVDIQQNLLSRDVAENVS